MKGYISKSTAALLAVIAMLVGALVVTITTTHRIPIFLDTAHAATSTVSMPFTTFAPVVKRAMPAVVNISSSKVVKDQGDEGQRHFQRSIFPAVLRRPHAAAGTAALGARHQSWLGRGGESGWLHPDQ